MELWEASADTATAIWGVLGDVNGFFGVVFALGVQSAVLPLNKEVRSWEGTHQHYEYAAPRSPWLQRLKPAA